MRPPDLYAQPRSVPAALRRLRVGGICAEALLVLALVISICVLIYMIGSDPVWSAGLVAAL